MHLEARYWRVPLAPAKLPYLAFTSLGITYWFEVFHLGLVIAPRIFRVVSDPGISFLALLDDLLVAAPSASICLTHPASPSNSLGPRVVRLT